MQGKGGVLSGMFKKAPKSKQTPKPSEDEGSTEVSFVLFVLIQVEIYNSF